MLPAIHERIARELSVQPRQVAATIELLDGGATVPFVARYRKEATGGLDDSQLRLLSERLVYLRELEDRRTAILDSIASQGKLSAELRAQILACDTKAGLEDIYLPYRPRRRTKAQIAREAGLEPLASGLLGNPRLEPLREAEAFVNADRGVPDARAALDGARQILMEQFAEDATLVGALRELMSTEAFLVSRVDEAKGGSSAPEITKFRDYFDYRERIADIPSHRALALFRGRNEEVLRLSLKLAEELQPSPPPLATPVRRVATRFDIQDLGRPADAWLLDTARWAWNVKLSLHLELDLMNALRERAEAEAIRVFAANLRDLLLAAPAGPRVTMGLDPGIRTGVKVAVVDGTGKLLDTATIYPHEPRRDWEGALRTLEAMATRHHVQLVAIGNGTASRETDRLAGDLIRRLPAAGITRIVVSEAGASVYSASELAAREFPDLDVSLRGAVSIARRLQDPLAELVKIDPKSIGVGQYQHDVSQLQLARQLDAVVEDCVNAVGVDVNTASAPLLTRISGLNATLAANIVGHRDRNGRFPSRAALREVPRLGDKTFEQAAGFLRIMDGDNPLDASSVHPEAYPVVERILETLGRSAREIIGDSATLRGLSPASFTDERFGLPTVQDILRELEKPARDPRPEFRTAAFREGIEALKDLQPGMLLEGVITNVTNFGAFVDVGVHQDGLVHISMLAERFVRDPREVVKAGDIVRVKVIDVDLQRRRIALSMRLGDETARGPAAAARTRQGPRNGDARPEKKKSSREERPAPPAGAMAIALSRALKP